MRRKGPTGLVIATADPTFGQRLRRRLGTGNHWRTISDVALHPDLPQQVATLQPCVILFDLGLVPNPEDLRLVSALSAVGKTIVLAEVDDDALAIRLLKAGASGLCRRDTAAALVRKAAELVEAGEIWIRRRVMLRLIEELATPRAPESPELAGAERLTFREREVAALVGRGAGNSQIAHQLSISIKTVKTHLTSIFKKLGLETRLQLAVAVGRRSVSQTKVG